MSLANEKGYEAMSGLVAALQQALQDLEAGKLSLDQLDRSTEEARMLYERLVVLRHKAREARNAPVAPPPARTEPSPIRLSTKPHEPLPGQTSLIDAIEAVEQVEEKPATPLPPPPATPPVEPPTPPKVDAPAATPLPPPPATPPAEPPSPPKVDAPKTEQPPPPKPSAPKAAPSKAAPTLASKFDQARGGDLHKAIALSQKFWFVAELFQGQREAYERAIDRINQQPDLASAKAIIDNEVVAKLPKPPAPDALATFMDLVERRFR
jgi:hypothetical protein